MKFKHFLLTLDSTVHEAQLCECVCVHMPVCGCVRVGLQGHLGPWFPAQDEWALLHHCLGQQQSRPRLVMFGVGGRLTGHVGAVYSTPGRGQGSPPSASILPLSLTGSWIQD